MKKVLVLSSHLDDGVLGAGQFIAGRGGNVDLLTVFSGIPMQKNLLTDYDRACGFKTSKDAMVIRRQEDFEACSLLNANPIHMKRLDSQYKKGGDYKGLSSELEAFIKKGNYELIVGPLGIIHNDHVELSNALISLGLPNLYLYEDLPHRVTHPELVFERLKNVPTTKLTFIGDGPIADKVRGLFCYRSQVGRGDLNPYNLYVSERFHKVGI